LFITCHIFWLKHKNNVLFSVVISKYYFLDKAASFSYLKIKIDAYYHNFLSECASKRVHQEENKLMLMIQISSNIQKTKMIFLKISNFKYSQFNASLAIRHAL
jgi:uncharacterized protein YmfQ (DUF2313 family)